MAYSNLGIYEPTPQDPAQANIWAATVNTNMTLLDNAVAGEVSVDVSGASNVTLTSTAGAANQYRNAVVGLAGTITSNIQVLWPTSVTIPFMAANATSGAHTVSLGVDNGSGTAAGSVVIIPQGVTGKFFSDGTNVVSVGSNWTTRQKLLSGTGATYTTPAGCTRIVVRMVGAGGGSGGTSSSSGATNGGTGGTTSFNAITAIGGGGSPAGNPNNNVYGGSGGTGGAGTASFRCPGNVGQSGQVSAGNGAYGGGGAGSLLGGGAVGGNGQVAAAANSGGGASGANEGNVAGATAPGGGGSGEYVEIVINGPAATYTYTIGAGGTAGTGSNANGAVGGSGIIIVDEYY